MEEIKVPISVVVITKNEESNIAPCLESVKWANEIIVVDDVSIDRTVEIAKQLGTKVLQRKMDVEGIHRNWAYAQAKNEWVLSLDADERVTDELKDEIDKLVRQGTDCSAFSIPIRNYIGNYWARFGGWYPAAKVKLFKRDKFKYEEVGVHPRVFIDGSCGHLKQDLIHYSYRNFGDFLNKLNRQTTLEAKKWSDDKRKMSFLRAFWRAIDRFFRSYIRKKGYKDGFIGFMFAFLAALYQLMSYAKYWEMKRGQARLLYLERNFKQRD